MCLPIFSDLIVIYVRRHIKCFINNTVCYYSFYTTSMGLYAICTPICFRMNERMYFQLFNFLKDDKIRNKFTSNKAKYALFTGPYTRIQIDSKSVNPM